MLTLTPCIPPPILLQSGVQSIQGIPEIPEPRRGLVLIPQIKDICQHFKISRSQDFKIPRVRVRANSSKIPSAFSCISSVVWSEIG